MIAALALPTTCPRCGATLRPEEARWLEAPPGYQPGLRWTHRRPDGEGTCHLTSGPPVGYGPGPPPRRGAGVKIPA